MAQRPDGVTAWTVLRQWYADICRTCGKPEADKAYRLYAIGLELYSAGLQDGHSGQSGIGHADTVHIERLETKMENPGVQINASGQGNIINVADYMLGVTNTVSQNVQKSSASAEVNTLVTKLAEQIASVGSKIDAPTAKQLGDDVKVLSSELAGSQRKKWYELSLEGIRDAATKVGEVATPIVETVLKLAPLLGAVLAGR